MEESRDLSLQEMDKIGADRDARTASFKAELERRRALGE
jgi:hypothetical protein